MVSDGFLSFWLLNNRLDDLLSGEEVPHAASVELISKRVEESVEDGICLCHNWKHLRAETSISTFCQVLDKKFSFTPVVTANASI